MGGVTGQMYNCVLHVAQKLLCHCLCNCTAANIEISNCTGLMELLCVLLCLALPLLLLLLHVAVSLAAWLPVLWLSATLCSCRSVVPC